MTERFTTCGLCHMETLVRNPHPEAGDPDKLLTVGPAYICPPCTQKNAHSWANRAQKAEALLVKWPEFMAEQVADWYGIYGAGPEDDHLEDCKCRMCFVEKLTGQITSYIGKVQSPLKKS